MWKFMGNKKKKILWWFRFTGEKKPKYDFACNQPKEKLPKLFNMGCSSASL